MYKSSQMILRSVWAIYYPQVVVKDHRCQQVYNTLAWGSD